MKDANLQNTSNLNSQRTIKMNSSKKILLVTENIGRTAPGIVFEKIINELAIKNDLVVLCINNKPLNQPPNSAKIYSNKSKFLEILINPKIKNRISKLSLIISGYDFGAFILSLVFKKIYDSNKLSIDNFDYIFSLISNHHISPLIFCESVKNHSQSIKNVSYFVDAIPAPLGWSKNNIEYKRLSAFIGERIKNLDILFSSNHKMLQYQLSKLKKPKDVKVGVLYTPTIENFKNFPTKPTNENNFLYTGGLYGKRTAKNIINALKIVLKNHPNTYLIFVGSTLSENDLLALDENERNHIKIHAFTENLDKFYSNSLALVDIDAEMEDDVFVSSKIINYLSINRPIISITGGNSPSREIFSGIKSIIQSSHNHVEIARHMIEVIESNTQLDYSDRSFIINKFLTRNIVKYAENFIEAN